MVKDPVCGMEINEKESPVQTTYENITYHFCTAECLEMFVKAPKKYSGIGDPK